MQKILVLKAKGGSGKTTIATNLAACYAARGQHPALLDYDPQGSALNWLHTRPGNKAPIHGVEAHKKSTAVTRSWQMRLPKQVERVIIDTPASIAGAQLTDYVRQANCIIVPVLPSPIDIHTATTFIKEIIMLGKVRSAAPSSASQETRLAVVANRVKENTRVYTSLVSFLSGLDIPLLTGLADSEYYNHAYVEGLGLHELRDARTQSLCNQWQPILDWLDQLPAVKSSTDRNSDEAPIRLTP